MGEVAEGDLERVETEISLLFASIQDCVRNKVKERIQEPEDIQLKENQRNLGKFRDTFKNPEI